MDLGDLYLETRSWAGRRARRTGEDPEDLVDAVSESAIDAATRRAPAPEDWRGRAIQAEAELAQARETIETLRAGRPDPLIASLQADLRNALRDIEILTRQVAQLRRTTCPT